MFIVDPVGSLYQGVILSPCLCLLFLAFHFKRYIKIILKELSVALSMQVPGFVTYYTIIQLRLGDTEL